ncbi:MAG TPA: ABC transporter substrate-binding protein [Actinophytocola sp.]|uniref:ABC transporter substrate-binding protein n=1 Tax=Actinophytocola sp. TaxID=1872138 RepID=UPI002DBC05D3|nr:ABC transporter substrate-binding protein [Actinophytocola sp.]HEU5474451.1 ABC transporter substrate-binding protein [Actinophytocola sp.]
MRVHRGVRGWAVAVAGILVLSACSGAGEAPSGGGGDQAPDTAPGVTDDTVVIGSHQPLTGPAAPGYSKISVAARAMYQYINDNGGINGRRIEYRVEDDAYNPTKTVEVVKKLVLEDQVFAIVGGLGTPTHSKVLDYLNQEGVPDLLVSSGALMWDQPRKYPMTFGYQVDYLREGKIQGNFIKENFAGKKIGLFFQGDDVGRDTQAGLDKYIKDQVVSRQAYDPANTDVTPQLLALKSSGVEVVVCECIPAFMALTLLTAAKIGFRPQFVASSIGSDPATLTGLLENFAKSSGATVSAQQLLTGFIGVGYLPRAGLLDDPWTKFFKQVHDKYIPNEAFTDTLIFGMAQAYTFAQALKAAGRDLGRRKLVETLETTQLKGPALVPFAYSKDSHAGYSGAYLVRNNGDGTATIVEEPVVTDREGGAVEPADTDRVDPDQTGLLSG